eukprot:TRINITY_DN27625_c0_g1_i1.p1 TRINITY_DN27625_c0_g1~~TRINITY_DN27625_c0_g1_i1.p1  ORF type:complete len:453 (+),score=84.89 TRINITY_DN27625_c0_g1_i1:91-1449(+)
MTSPRSPVSPGSRKSLKKQSSSFYIKGAGPELDEDPLAKSVQEIFARFDHSGDGAFDPQELGKLLKTLLPTLGHDGKNGPRVSQLVAEIDRGGDGNVSYREFLSWLRKGGEGTAEVKRALAKNTGEAREARIKDVFKKFDCSGDGSLDVEELERTLVNLGAFTKMEVKHIIADLDANQDGLVSYEEFANWIKAASGEKEILKAKAILAPSDSDGLEAIFYNFCGPGKAELDSKGFLKLMTHAKLCNKEALPAASVDLIFADVRAKPKGHRCIDFDQFEASLDVMAEKMSLPTAQIRAACLEATSQLAPSKFKSAARKVAMANLFEIDKLPEPEQVCRKPSVSAKLQVDDWKRTVDNRELWKVFGLGSSAGKLLKCVYAPGPPCLADVSQQANKPMTTSTSLPSLSLGSTSSRPGTDPLRRKAARPPPTAPQPPPVVLAQGWSAHNRSVTWLG